MYGDKDIVKRSFSIFLILFIILLVMSIILKKISLALGFVLGYALCLLNFKLLTIMVDAILASTKKISVFLAIFNHIFIVFIYSIGFLLAVKFPAFFNLFTVTIGYFVLKLSIFYYDNRIRKRGEDM